MTLFYALVVPEEDVEEVKTSLQYGAILHKQIKIHPFIGSPHSSFSGRASIVPTKLVCSPAHHNDLSDVSGLDDSSSLALISCMPTDLSSRLRSNIYKIIIVDSSISMKKDITHNHLHSAFRRALSQTLSEMLTSHSIAATLCALPTAYCIYPPMLMLPSKTLNHPALAPMLDVLNNDGDLRLKFFADVARDMRVTHIVINAPIPAQIAEYEFGGCKISHDNYLRSPSNLQPLHGDFGPTLPAFPAHIPTRSDFEHAFWISTCQNGIKQVWAPRYTMFSSGNVTEKARVLHLASVREAVQQGREAGTGCTAVDLFAGIGYFAFSYAKAGVAKVLCWDLNPWSVEGFRRGAARNKWPCRLFTTDGNHKTQDFESKENIDDHGGRISERLWIFQESNVHASGRIHVLRGQIPPIRHVNCGMLPTVGAAWQTAVQVLDPQLGGWLHLHETVRQSEMERREKEVIDLVVNYIDEHQGFKRQDPRDQVVLEHVEWVKSVGPKLWHLVFDIWIPPRSTTFKSGPVELNYGRNHNSVDAI